MLVTSQNRTIGASIALAALTLAAPQLAESATITPETLQAWDQQVRQSQRQLMQEASSPDLFFRIASQTGLIEKVQSGEVLAQHSQHGGLVPVPAGLIHHWIGTIFIPNARSFDVLSTLQDYNSYASTYNPAVIESRLVSRTQDKFDYKLKFTAKGFGLKTGLIGDFSSRYFRVDRSSGYSVTESNQLIEVDDIGAAEERQLSFSESRGYVEKMFTIVRYREADGGSYISVETLTLSRDIPASVRWMISPFIQRFSRQVMTGTLDKLRNRVETTHLAESASR